MKAASEPAEIPERPSNGGDSLHSSMDWLVYAGIAVCGMATALVGPYRVEADTVAYLDLADAIRRHHWHAGVNASWFPLYPALLVVGKFFWGTNLRDSTQYDLMSARLVDWVLGLFFVLSSVILAVAASRLGLARGIKADRLLPQRTLYLWVATLAYFFHSQDLTGIKPDTLVSSLMILTVAAVLWGIAEERMAGFAAAGLCGGLAFWTKSFAFPFFFLWLAFVAMVNLRRLRVLGGLLVSVTMFGLVAGPYLGLISEAKGRFTIGDAGRVNSAWYVNGADRFNPVNDFSVYQAGNAQVNFKHPGELLSKAPEITYYGGDQVYGSTPQWDDFSYWSDGIAPRFNIRQTATAVKGNLTALSLILPMRLQVLFLIAALSLWGFTARVWALPDPALSMTFLLALASILSFLLVHFEARYVAFTFVICGAVYAACSVTPQRTDGRSLHIAVLLTAGLLLTYGLQSDLREWKKARSEGARPFNGIYNLPVFSAGSNLAALYPPGSEVACMGDAACWRDTIWAKNAEVKMTAIIETGPGDVTRSAEQGCERLQRNPAGILLLRQHHVRAIIAEFDGTMPCSSEWRPLGRSSNYFYLPL